MSKVTDREMIEMAVARLKTALKYGDDMDSSRLLCVRDAQRILARARRATHEKIKQKLK